MQGVKEQTSSLYARQLCGKMGSLLWILMLSIKANEQVILEVWKTRFNERKISEGE
jgi:hypothetical protein